MSNLNSPGQQKTAWVRFWSKIMNRRVLQNSIKGGVRGSERNGYIVELLRQSYFNSNMEIYWHKRIPSGEGL